jgi:hypothetical protein
MLFHGAPRCAPSRPLTEPRPPTSTPPRRSSAHYWRASRTPKQPSPSSMLACARCSGARAWPSQISLRFSPSSSPPGSAGLWPTNPAPVLRRTRIPVLALNGSLDAQVLAGLNVPVMQAAFQDAGNTQASVSELPGLNHLFQHAVTGSVSQYGLILETMAPEVIAQIADWIGSLSPHADQRREKAPPTATQPRPSRETPKIFATGKAEGPRQDRRRRAGTRSTPGHYGTVQRGTRGNRRSLAGRLRRWWGHCPWTRRGSPAVHARQQGCWHSFASSIARL